MFIERRFLRSISTLRCNMKIFLFHFSALFFLIFSLRFFSILDDFERTKLYFFCVSIAWFVSLFSIWFLLGFKKVCAWIAVSLCLVFCILRTPNLVGYSIDISKTASNFPTIQEGDIIISRHFSIDYTRGIYVGFDWNGKLYRKRIYGVPGDEILQCNGKLYVNGKAYHATLNFIPESITSSSCHDGDSSGVVLGADQFYLLGDNESNSYDSKVFGPVNRNAIVANAIYKISAGKGIYLNVDM
jgi:signal peptidase I